MSAARDGVSPEVWAFLEEIKQVCMRHGLILTTSGYDIFEVWPMDFYYLSCIGTAEDRTR